MDHIVYLDTKARELEKLLAGEKTMIIRGATGRKLPYGRVQTNDRLYFIQNKGGGMVRACALVNEVFNSEKLTEEQSGHLLETNQAKFTEIYMKTILIIVCILAALFLLIWLGLKIKPAPFSPYPEQEPTLETVSLPVGLPAPVERFYKTAYGDEIPVIETIVTKGRANISPFGVKLPARFLFVHNAGKDYRHYIEATWFGLPIMKVNEGYVDGKSFFESPMGNISDDASTNQAANLAVWAEAVWFPSIWLTDERVRWEPVDDVTALLFVPFEDQEENFIVRFNPETGLIDTMEAMRYRDSGDQAKKILWITRTEPGGKIQGTKLGSVGSAIWLDQGKPWAVFALEEVKYNVDVSDYIWQKGK